MSNERPGTTVHLTDGSTVTAPPLENLSIEERRILARPLLKVIAEGMATEFREEHGKTVNTVVKVGTPPPPKIRPDWLNEPLENFRPYPHG